MNEKHSQRSYLLIALAVVAILFGGVTLKSGAGVLFTEEARIAAGNYVPFVLWFNWLAGFAYVAAGVGFLLRQRWAMYLAFGLAAATFVVFAAFGLHIALGGLFETRTVVMMTVRTSVWVVASIIAYRKMAAHAGAE